MTRDRRNGTAGPDRRSVTLGLMGTLAAPAVLRAQTGGWPKDKPIKVVVPFVAGGATDIIGRIMADKLSQMWGANIIVENKGGAGGNLGMEQTAKSAADGYTWMVASPGYSINQFLYGSLPFDPTKDFEPVTLLAMVPNILVVSKNVQAKNVAEVIAYAKANPGKMTYASSGIGTSIHLSAELFKKMAGVDIVHVPYRGSSQALQDLISGQTDIMFDNITSSIQHVRGGALRALGITTAKPSALAPDLVPIAQTVPGFDTSSWFGFAVPAKTPKEMIAKIQADSKIALADPAVKAKMAELGAEIVGNTPAEFAAFIKDEDAKWGKLIKEGGIKAQ